MKRRIDRFVFAVLVVLLLSLDVAADLRKRINAILAEPANRKVSFSINIIKASTGRSVYSHDAKELSIPASNMKLITTAAALHYLGTDFEYKTRVGLSGKTLVIIGSGDPIFGDPVIDAREKREEGWILRDIAAALKEKGITEIEDIVIDTTVFDDERVHPNWPLKELNRWYAAEVCGLNYNNNCVNVVVKNNGGRIEFAVQPKTNYLDFVNEVEPVSKGGSAIGAHRLTPPNKVCLTGKCQTQATIPDMAIQRPAAFFAFLLAENFVREGIKPKGQIIERAFTERDDFELLFEYTSPISDCLWRCNKPSLGLVAECLLKTIAANSGLTEDGGSWELGRELISQYLSDVVGVDKSQFFIDDASGLSRINELTAHAITKLLLNLYKSRRWEVYKASLPIGGVDGTIAEYFYQSKYKGRVFAKTGFMDGVRALSGLCITKKGDYLFSILANKANGVTKKALHDITKAIIDDAEPRVKKPTKETKKAAPKTEEPNE